MRLLALDTDIEGVKRRFLSAEEQEILTVFRHGFFFFLSIIYQIFLTVALIAAGIGIRAVDLPWEISLWWIIAAIAIAWLLFAFPTVLKAFLDWKFDFIFVTTEKVVIVDQSSLFHQKITPMHLENFASVTAATQFWNLFSFGALHFQLKEGIGEDITTKYIPHARDVAAKISDTVTQYHRRFMELPPPPSSQRNGEPPPSQ